MKILDCFGFCGENEILEIRLETLFEYVDKFVIIEGNKFFNGTGKKKLFDIENFKKYKSKIKLYYISIMNFSCKKCEKNFETKSGLYKHNVTYHPKNNDDKKLNNICKYCDKLLSSYGCKWRHEQNCSLNSNKFIHKIENMQKEIKDLKSKISSNPQTINNKLINSNNTQNIICVFPFGKEPNNVLSIEYLTKSLNELGINSVIDIVKKKHFNPELPQLHNFCVTAKNDNYASIVDPETKK